MKVIHTPSFSRNSQQGAVLVVSLLILLVLTILAVSMSQTARLQERMTGNMRDSDMAFQSAEAGLRAGELLIHDFDINPDWCLSPKDQEGCDIFEPGALDEVDLRVDETFWTANGVEYGTAGTQDIEDVTDDPTYLVEFIEFVPDEVGGVPDMSRGRHFYKITSRATGKTETARAVLESTYAERF